MKKKLLIILSLLCVHSYAQNSRADRDYQQAEICFKDGQYDKANDYIFQYILNDGDESKASELKKKINDCKETYNIAEALFSAQNYKEALIQYQKLKMLNPSHPNLGSRIDSCLNGISTQSKGRDQSESQATRAQSTPEWSSNSYSYTARKNYNPLEPEGFTMELGVIGGTNLGISMDFTASYFLIGCGIDWIMITPERTMITNLVNSGYTGNFIKQTTISLSGSCTNIFLNLGTYFKYFSISCQVGLLCGTIVNRSSLYDGSGYGLVDGDLNEYWGSYRQQSFSNSTSDNELHMTLTPQVKGYIPIGNYSITLGLGYTFIPTLGYNTGLSGNLGFHIRF